MKTPELGRVEEGGNVIGAWIERFGLAAVFACILLAFVLWSSYSLSTAVMPMLERVVASQERMATSQAETAAVLRELRLEVVKGCTNIR